MGGCHRTEPVPKATRSNGAVRSNKEVKPVVISVTPDPPSKPVVIRKRDAMTDSPIVPVVQLPRGKDQTSHHIGLDSNRDAISPSSISESKTSERKSLSSQDKVDEPKKVASRVPSSTSGEAAIAARKPATNRSGSAKPGTEPVRDAGKPWERPLEVPSTARVQKQSKTKTAGASAASLQMPKEPSSPPVQVKSPIEGAIVPQEQPIPAVNPSALEAGTVVANSTVQAPPLAGAGSIGAKVDESRAHRETVDQKSTETAKKDEQKADEKITRGPALTVAKPSAETVPGASKESENRLNQPEDSANSVQSQAVPTTDQTGLLVTNPQTAVDQVAKSATKIPASAPKKLSESERREEIRRQATESYRSGQQLIRESRNTEAMQAFKQSVKLMPGSADAWLRIAYLLEREGNIEEARRAFREAKKLWSF
jgi:TolA-binding protein